MFERLDEVVAEYEDILAKLSDPAVIADQRSLRELSQRHHEIGPVVAAYRCIPGHRKRTSRSPRDVGRCRRRGPRAPQQRDQRGRGTAGRPRGRAEAPAAAQGPQRRAQRDRGDPGRRGRRRSQPVRPGSLRDVLALRGTYRSQSRSPLERCLPQGRRQRGDAARQGSRTPGHT